MDEELVSGPHTVTLYRSGAGFGFTLRHFIVYPPESAIQQLQREVEMCSVTDDLHKTPVKLNALDPMDTIFVKGVKDHGPAHMAGLNKGDRIISVNGERVAGKSYAQIISMIQSSESRLVLLVVPKHDDILQMVYETTVTNQSAVSYKGGMINIPDPPGMDTQNLIIGKSSSLSSSQATVSQYAQTPYFTTSVTYPNCNKEDSNSKKEVEQPTMNFEKNHKFMMDTEVLSAYALENQEPTHDNISNPRNPHSFDKPYISKGPSISDVSSEIMNNPLSLIISDSLNASESLRHFDAHDVGYMKNAFSGELSSEYCQSISAYDDNNSINDVERVISGTNNIHQCDSLSSTQNNSDDWTDNSSLLIFCDSSTDHSLNLMMKLPKNKSDGSKKQRIRQDSSAFSASNRSSTNTGFCHRYDTRVDKLKDGKQLTEKTPHQFPSAQTGNMKLEYFNTDKISPNGMKNSADIVDFSAKLHKNRQFHSLEQMDKQISPDYTCRITAKQSDIVNASPGSRHKTATRQPSYVAAVSESEKKDEMDSDVHLVRRRSYLLATGQNHKEYSFGGVDIPKFEKSPKAPVQPLSQTPVRTRNIKKLKNLFGERTPRIVEAMADQKCVPVIPNSVANITLEGALNYKFAITDGKRANDRSWNSAYAQLQGNKLYLFKERYTVPRIADLSISIKSGIADIANDYTKKKNVFRLTTFNGSEYLFQADDHETMIQWIHMIQAQNKIHTKNDSEEDEKSRGINDQPVLYDTTQNSLQTTQKTKESTTKSAGSKSLPSISPGCRTKKLQSEKDYIDLGVPRYKDSRTWKDRMTKKFRRYGSSSSTSAEMAENSEAEVTGTFGVLLEYCPSASFSEFVPMVVEVCTKIIEERGISCQGIYRVPGNTGAVSILQEELNNTTGIDILDLDIEKWMDVNVIGSLLKSFFRKLPNPLITEDLYHSIIIANRIANPEKRMLKIKKLLHDLPEHHFETFRYLAEHLSKVANHSEINKMDGRNLAIVFGPTLIRTADENMVTMVTDMSDQCRIVESIILNNHWFFSSWFEDINVPVDENTETVPVSSMNQELIVKAGNLEFGDRAKDVRVKDRMSSVIQAANRRMRIRKDKPKGSSSIDIDSELLTYNERNIDHEIELRDSTLIPRITSDMSLGKQVMVTTTSQSSISDNISRSLSETNIKGGRVIQKMFSPVTERVSSHSHAGDLGPETFDLKNELCITQVKVNETSNLAITRYPAYPKVNVSSPQTDNSKPILLKKYSSDVIFGGKNVTEKNYGQIHFPRWKLKQLELHSESFKQKEEKKKERERHIQARARIELELQKTQMELQMDNILDTRNTTRETNNLFECEQQYCHYMKNTMHNLCTAMNSAASPSLRICHSPQLNTQETACSCENFGNHEIVENVDATSGAIQHDHADCCSYIDETNTDHHNPGIISADEQSRVFLNDIHLIGSEKQNLLQMSENSTNYIDHIKGSKNGISPVVSNDSSVKRYPLRAEHGGMLDQCSTHKDTVLGRELNIRSLAPARELKLIGVESRFERQNNLHDREEKTFPSMCSSEYTVAESIQMLQGITLEGMNEQHGLKMAHSSMLLDESKRKPCSPKLTPSPSQLLPFQKDKVSSNLIRSHSIQQLLYAAYISPKTNLCTTKSDNTTCGVSPQNSLICSFSESKLPGRILNRAYTKFKQRRSTICSFFNVEYYEPLLGAAYRYDQTPLLELHPENPLTLNNTSGQQSQDMQKNILL